MIEFSDIDGQHLAYDVTGVALLVVLDHGMADSGHSYRFVAPALVAAGSRVANVDTLGGGESSLGWDGYSRTDISGDLVAAIRHRGGPALLMGHSISGGAAAIAATTAPEVVAGVMGLFPFTRKQSVCLSGLFDLKRYRAGSTQLGRVMYLASLSAWMKYRDLAYPTKPPDRASTLSRIETTMGDPARMEARQAMCKSVPTDADLPVGLGELAVIEDAGQYPHAQTPDEVVALALPFLARTLARA